MHPMMFNVPVPPPMSVGGRVAPLLISMAAGYAILVLASKQPKKLANLGRGVAWLIMGVSLIGLLCLAAVGLCGSCKRGGPGKNWCPWKGKEARTMCAPAADAAPANETVVQ